MSQTLNIKNIDGMRVVSCSNCDHEISNAEDSWKKKAVLQEQKMNDLGEPFTTGNEVYLRSFNCPGCGSLLDTEVAMKNDPFLEDRIFE